MGYRGYDGLGITPLLPFGYGLSYTTFGCSNLQVAVPAARQSAVPRPDARDPYRNARRN